MSDFSNKNVLFLHIFVLKSRVDFRQLQYIFNVVLKKFGKNKKREHYTDIKKICTQIIDECKKSADGNFNSGLYDAKKFLRDLFNAKGRRCK